MPNFAPWRRLIMGENEKTVVAVCAWILVCCIITAISITTILEPRVITVHEPKVDIREEIATAIQNTTMYIWIDGSGHCFILSAIGGTPYFPMKCTTIHPLKPEGWPNG